jgi:thiamine pyrophosphokinase
MREEFDAVIVADGDFPTHPIPLGILSRTRFVVCCDGAIRNLSNFRDNPCETVANTSVAVVGDGDSVPDAYRHLLIQVTEQEDNDLTKATRYCLDRLSTCRPVSTCRPASACRPVCGDVIATPAPLRIAYLGCTGRREDHTLGNISLLMRYYRDMAVEGVMFTDHGFFTPAQGLRTFVSEPRQQVSIFNFGCTSIQSEGLRWNSYAYKEWWQGTLNEALDTTFTLRSDGFYMVYQTYDTKQG